MKSAKNNRKPEIDWWFITMFALLFGMCGLIALASAGCATDGARKVSNPGVFQHSMPVTAAWRAQ